MINAAAAADNREAIAATVRHYLDGAVSRNGEAVHAVEDGRAVEDHDQGILPPPRGVMISK